MTVLKQLATCAGAFVMLGLSALSASADALDDIKAAGQIKVGIFSGFPLFSSASSDLSIQGYDVDVANFIAEKMGVEDNLVSVTGQNRIPLLNDGRVDILLSVGYSDERAQVIDYAAAYAPS
ncbi:transporter substrate-binding domain-containing protein [Roseobacter sp. A03A-229]